MAGDYTRFSFDPIKGYSGVHKQQGRVSLDSEFNEFEEILDRRDRAEMYDTVGQAVVPVTTLTGFQIGIDGTGQLTIGIGRAYVDGIPAECYGDMSNPATTLRDDHVGGVTGSGPVRYDQQPFFYQPAFPALSPTAGVINLVYLDVWQREVTVFEDEELREPALNGPDTATRVQTAWQVKVLQPADAQSCATPPASWTTLTAASTARLSAQAVPAVPAAGPCVINPAGGYTGLENRLYRVEIHRAGTLTGAGGTTRAQFKWSRDNASLAARVLSIAPVAGVPTDSIITVASTGRDAWMRFEPGHHIELLDDSVEYAMRESGIGGPMARVLSVNHATGEIRIDQNLAAFAIVAARHPRIRRWDIAGAAEPLVRDTSNGTAIALEEGITITFGGSNSDTLHAGDHWVFAARTADGSIDTLINAPPRGILHHFARLALVTSGTPPSLLSDCRIFWPRDGGCCTVVVRPGQSIQAAIDSLPAAGGCVCLKAGIHPVTATIQLARSNVHLHGESEGAEIHSPGLFETLHIGAATGSPVHDVMVEHLRIVVASGGGGGLVIGIDNAARVTVRETQISVTSLGAPFPDPYAGVFVDNCSDVVIAGNTVSNVFHGAIVEDVGARAWICDNRFTGVVYSAAAFSASFGDIGVYLGSDVSGDHRIERNAIHHFMTGVLVAPGSQGGTVAANRILRVGGPATGTVPLTVAAMRTYMDSRLYGIELAGGRCTAQDNHIEMQSPAWGGIRVRTEGAVVTGNVLIGNQPGTELLVPASIYCTVDATGARNGSGSTLSDNTLQGPQTGIVVSRVTGVAVSGNRIDGTARGWFGVRIDDASRTTVAGNLIAAVGFGFSLSEGDHNIVSDNRLASALIGVLAAGESDLSVHGNEITGAMFGGLTLLIASGDVLVTRNRIANCGWAGLGTIQGAVFVMTNLLTGFSRSTLRIESCEITEPGVAPDGTLATGAVRGIHAFVPNCQILDNRVVSTDPRLIGSTAEHRALLLLGPLSYAPLVIGMSSAVVTSNVFRGPGHTHLVQFARMPITDNIGFWFHKIVFSSNFCDHYTAAGNDNAATALLSGLHVVANANQITSQRGVKSMNGIGSSLASVVGNITSGDIVSFPAGPPSTRPAPITDFNVKIF